MAILKLVFYKYRWLIKKVLTLHSIHLTFFSHFIDYRTVDGKIAHYPIVKMNDLYYFNDFPFPYLESIVLYYKKYKFKDTKLTNQVSRSLFTLLRAIFSPVTVSEDSIFRLLSFWFSEMNK